MEDVLEVYTRPYDERFPQVCLDELSKQLVGEVREPLAVCPGRPARYDCEYEREGTANLFIVNEPLAGSGLTSASPSDGRSSTGRIA
jgi:hypothetical protein